MAERKLTRMYNPKTRARVCCNDDQIADREKEGFVIHEEETRGEGQDAQAEAKVGITGKGDLTVEGESSGEGALG